MPAAARTTDTVAITHCPGNTTASGGSTNVIIEGLGAHILGHSNSSHAVDGTDPPCDSTHSTALDSGSENVYINGQKAGRVGDTYSCTALISSGASHVFINDAPIEVPLVESTNSYYNEADLDDLVAEIIYRATGVELLRSVAQITRQNSDVRSVNDINEHIQKWKAADSYSRAELLSSWNASANKIEDVKGTAAHIIRSFTLPGRNDSVEYNKSTAKVVDVSDKFLLDRIDSLESSFNDWRKTKNIKSFDRVQVIVEELRTMYGDTNIRKWLEYTEYTLTKPVIVVKFTNWPIHQYPEYSAGSMHSTMIVHVDDPMFPAGTTFDDFAKVYGDNANTYKLDAGSVIYHTRGFGDEASGEILVKGNTLNKAKAIPLSEFNVINQHKAPRTKILISSHQDAYVISTEAFDFEASRQSVDLSSRLEVTFKNGLLKVDMIRTNAGSDVKNLAQVFMDKLLQDPKFKGINRFSPESMTTNGSQFINGYISRLARQWKANPTAFFKKYPNISANTQFSIPSLELDIKGPNIVGTPNRSFIPGQAPLVTRIDGSGVNANVFKDVKLLGEYFSDIIKYKSVFANKEQLKTKIVSFSADSDAYEKHVIAGTSTELNKAFGYDRIINPGDGTHPVWNAIERGQDRVPFGVNISSKIWNSVVVERAYGKLKDYVINYAGTAKERWNVSLNDSVGVKVVGVLRTLGNISFFLTAPIIHDEWDEAGGFIEHYEQNVGGTMQSIYNWFTDAAYGKDSIYSYLYLNNEDDDSQLTRAAKQSYNMNVYNALLIWGNGTGLALAGVFAVMSAADPLAWIVDEYIIGPYEDSGIHIAPYSSIIYEMSDYIYQTNITR
jgi:uncharacterized Zn-binding protein involved in type VI secretion